MAMRTTEEVIGSYRNGREDAAKICEEMAEDAESIATDYARTNASNYDREAAEKWRAHARQHRKAAARIRGEGMEDREEEEKRNSDEKYIISPDERVRLRDIRRRRKSSVNSNGDGDLKEDLDFLFTLISRLSWEYF